MQRVWHQLRMCATFNLNSERPGSLLPTPLNVIDQVAHQVDPQCFNQWQTDSSVYSQKSHNHIHVMACGPIATLATPPGLEQPQAKWATSHSPASHLQWCCLTAYRLHRWPQHMNAVLTTHDKHFSNPHRMCAAPHPDKAHNLTTHAHKKALH